MTDILCQLLAEVDTIPQDSVDELLSRLLPKNAVCVRDAQHSSLH